MKRLLIIVLGIAATVALAVAIVTLVPRATEAQGDPPCACSADASAGEACPHCDDGCEECEDCAAEGCTACAGEGCEHCEAGCEAGCDGCEAGCEHCGEGGDHAGSHTHSDASGAAAPSATTHERPAAVIAA